MYLNPVHVTRHFIPRALSRRLFRVHDSALRVNGTDIREFFYVVVLSLSYSPAFVATRIIVRE